MGRQRRKPGDPDRRNLTYVALAGSILIIAAAVAVALVVPLLHGSCSQVEAGFDKHGQADYNAKVSLKGCS